jgi:hypothetical protein
MKKLDIIRNILESAKIHHNIRIDYARARKAIEKAKLTDEQAESFNTDMQIEGYMVEQFKETFEMYTENPLNDSGNRNLGEKCEIKGEIWSYGRMGATLYWDAYWIGNNSGFGFKYDENDLSDMQIDELKEILRDITEFNNQIEGLMNSYYAELEYKAIEHKQNCIDDEKQAKYDKLIAPYNVNLYELSKEKDNTIKRQAMSLIKLLNIK